MSNGQTLSPSLRTDIYTLIDQTKVWLASGHPGDGTSYETMLSTIQKHFPDANGPVLEIYAPAEGEIAVIVGGVTNMILELSKWEGLAAGMAMRTWVDGIVDAHSRSFKKGTVARGITRGFIQFTDASLLTNDLTARIQIVSSAKTVSVRIYGAGSDEAKHSEALWNSKFF